MTNIEVRRLKNQFLAMSVATVLVVYAIGVAIPTLTPAPAFATNYGNNDHYDNNNKHDDKNKHYDNNNYESQFLTDVEQCFPNNGNHDEQFSDDVKECIYDVITAYFDNDNNNNNDNNHNNNHESTSYDSSSTSRSTSNGGTSNGGTSNSMSTSNGNERLNPLITR